MQVVWKLIENGGGMAAEELYFYYEFKNHKLCSIIKIQYMLLWDMHDAWKFRFFTLMNFAEKLLISRGFSPVCGWKNAQHGPWSDSTKYKVPSDPCRPLASRWRASTSGLSYWILQLFYLWCLYPKLGKWI